MFTAHSVCGKIPKNIKISGQLIKNFDFIQNNWLICTVGCSKKILWWNMPRVIIAHYNDVYNCSLNTKSVKIPSQDINIFGTPWYMRKSCNIMGLFMKILFFYGWRRPHDWVYILYQMMWCSHWVNVIAPPQNLVWGQTRLSPSFPGIVANKK